MLCPKEKARRSGPLCIRTSAGSALGELEGPAGLGAAVLLALDHAAVAGEKAAALQNAAQLGLVMGERLGDAVAHGAGLTREPATGYGGDHVVLAVAVGGDDGLLQDHLEHRAGEVSDKFLAVDGDLAAA